MLPVNLDTVRLFLHVLAATVWVGGQLTLVGLVSVARRMSPDAPKLLARRFSAVAWPAYGVLILTGIWNVIADHQPLRGAYRTTLAIKIAVVALSGSAPGHTAPAARTPDGLCGERWPA